MKKLSILMATVLLSVSGVATVAAAAGQYAMEITEKFVADVSDANVCGDFNVVKVFDLSVDEHDVDQNGNFVLSAENLATIQKEAKNLISFNEGLFVAQRGGAAIENLTAALGLMRNRRGDFVLKSCHDMSIIESFKLKVDRDRLLPIDDQVGSNYFTFGVVDDETQDAQYLKYHVFVDLDQKQLTIFTVF